jgi:two-component system chemotaxis sensor kinase CheA
LSPPSKGHSEFVAEANEILETLARDLHVLEDAGGDADPDLLNAVFRAAHSLKGLAGMFGEERISRLAHTAEDVLDRLRMGKLDLSPPVLDQLAETVDVLQALLSETAKGVSSEAVTERGKLQQERLATLGAPTPVAPVDPLSTLPLDPQIRAVFTEYEEHRLRENVKRGMALWKVRAAFDLSDFDVRLGELNARLKPHGEVISTLPSSEPTDPTGIAFDLIFGSRSAGLELEAAVQGLPVRVSSIAPGAPTEDNPPPPRKAYPAPTPVAPPPAKVAPVQVAAANDEEPSSSPREEERPGEQSLRSLTQTVRVDIARLDALMNAVGELLLIRANVGRLAESARQGAGVALTKLWGQELWRESRMLERKLDELQKGILDVRMVPLGQVFDKLARLVRKIARDRGKDLEFKISGGDVELDKLLVEELSDPLMHLIRNSIDHGIEAPEVRESWGKPRRGTVSLRASQKGNHVVIEVADDGAGLSVERIREVAIQRGLITAQQADEMSHRELQNLIFLPGFSTAKQVSDLSGRGVGLDVVKTNLSNMSGMIDVTSELGQGTTMVLTLPVTLAIIRALIVSVSDRIYAVPLNSVLEIVAVPEDEIRTVERREVISLRGQTLAFSRLARMFGLPERPVKRHFVVVVGLAQERLGIAVDELLGQQDIVIKPLGGRLSHVTGISGATDLGNRQTVLVLDVGALVEEVINPERRAEFL